MVDCKYYSIAVFENVLIISQYSGSGQVLKHENLDNYFNLKVPSLRKFHGEKTNGVVKVSSIKLLAHVAQSLQR